MRRAKAQGVTYAELGRQWRVSQCHARRLVLGLREHHGIKLAHERASDRELKKFMNALRECLGLDPLSYQKEATTAERFYIPPYPDVSELEAAE
jgi:hypothetical protein